MTESPHISVLLDEVIEYLNPEDGKTYIDGTFGAGGHTSKILEKADCQVIAIDRDPNAQQFADQLEKRFPGKIQLCLGKFSEMETLIAGHGIQQVDGIILDIGVSSMQIDEAERGFSFSKEGPLDMRMGQSGEDASSFINTASEEEIANVIYQFGEERKSRRIAKAIVQERVKEPITTTVQLASIVRSVLPAHKGGIDPATRTFQAIRIWVNDEIQELKEALVAMEKLVAPGGRIVVISFHSLEDKLVKQCFKELCGKTNQVSRHMPVQPDATSDNVEFSQLTRKAVKPTEEEIAHNPRARSARLRAIIRHKKEEDQ